MAENLHSLARHGRHAQIKSMLDAAGRPAHCVVDARDSRQNTPLIVAGQNNQVGVARVLLHRGADINAANAMGNTALHYAAAFGYYWPQGSIGQYLMGKGERNRRTGERVSTRT